MTETFGADLAAWLDYISTQHVSEIELGLARLRQVADRLELKSFSCPLITVAGTNGKGSSITALEKFYTASGYRTGCYTSPHLTVFNERIRVNGNFASDDRICDAFSQINSARGDISLTYFEFATLAAFIIFTQSGLDVVLLEVGLGGRLDASNLFPADVALITSIGIDHTDWLGGDRESIAAEKAGIIHTGKIAVISDPKPPKSLLKIAKQKADKVYLLNQNFCYERQQAGWWWKSEQKTLSNLPLSGMRGVPQFNNLAGVLMCMEALQSQLPVADETIQRELPNIRLQGRFQVIDSRPVIIFDVAHNPDSTALLAENLQQKPVPGMTHAVVGMLKDKDISESLANLLSSIDYWYLTGLPVSRGEKPETLQSMLLKIDPFASSQVFAEVDQAWEYALTQASINDRIVVFGSFHTVGAIISISSLSDR
jgi:dihydrofolate synthase/folylpolyglutamate synthase